MVNQQLYDDIKYGTNIIPEDEYLDTLTGIADVATNMVEKTLGPYGRTTMLHDGTFTYPTKDGWSVLKSLKWNDPIFNVLYGVLRQVSFDLVSKVGDGTTTAFVGASIFIHKIKDYLESHEYRQSDLLERLNCIKDEVIAAFQESKYVKKINVNGDFEDIYQIAKVSSNGNEELARIIQSIYQQTNNPNIYVTLDPSEKLRYEIQKGYKLDCKVIAQELYRNGEDGTYGESAGMNVFIFDHNVSFQNHQALINAISNYTNATRSISMIIAPHFDDVMLNVIKTAMMSLVNQQGGIPNLLLVQVPLSMDIHRAYLSDVVLLTKAQVFDYAKVSAFNTLIHNLDHPDEKMEDALLNTEQYMNKSPSEIIHMCVGHAQKIVAGEKYVLFQEYEKVVNPIQYNSTLDDVKKKYLELKEKAEKSSSPLMKDFMDAYQHYTKLTGNLGVILVGGTSELEKHFVRDAVDDAVLACRSAYDHGYVRGLNLAIMNVIKSQISSTPEDNEIRLMLYETFKEISLKVLENKTPNDVKSTISILDTYGGTARAEMTNEEILREAVEREYGFDLVHDTLMPDSECYIVNSVKTDVEVLKGMISIVSTMLTSNQFLSLHRGYDRAMGQKQREEMLLKQKGEEARVISEAVVKTLKESGVIKNAPVKITYTGPLNMKK